MLLSMGAIPANLIAMILLAATSIAAAMLLRWARCPGWPLVGGVVAGILLGPGIFGRVAPDRFERLFVGGVEQRERVHELERDLAIAGSPVADLSAEEIGAMTESSRPQLEQAQAELDAARHAHGQPLRIVACIAAALVLLASASPPARDTPAEGHGQAALISALSIGAWQAAFPAAVAFYLGRWWEFGVVESLLAAAAVAIGPWRLARFERDAADQVELGGARTIWNAGRVASLIAIALVIASIVLTRERGPSWPMAILFVLPLGWIARALTGQRGSTLRPEKAHAPGEPSAPPARWLRCVVDIAALPIVAAAATVAIEIFEDFNGWLLIVMLLLSGDGRWLGAMIGALLPGGRQMLRAMRLVLGSIAAGPTQIVVAMLAIQSGLIGGEVAMALVAGAVLIELALPLRRSMARRLAEVEGQLSD
jgi:hypothetical protein